MNKKIWLSSPHIGDVEQKYVQEAFDTNWIAPLGPNVNEFEKGIQNYIGENKFVAALSSGTAALHLALILADVNATDVVICQSLTFVATANPILYRGATPVFVDSESETWNMDPELLEKAITESITKGKLPKAIVVVDIYGVPAKLNEISKIAKKYNIQLIEDAAEALGSSLHNRMCGTYGDFGVFSFNGNKIITTSAGGALVVDNLTQKKEAIYLSSQAKSDVNFYEHKKVGYNYRMSNILAGIGRGQMEVLKDRIAARRLNYERYRYELSSIKNIHFVPELNGSISNRWLTCILMKSFEAKEMVRLALERENIEARYLWKPMHQQPIFKNYQAYVNGISDNLFEKGLCLPSGSNLTQQEIRKIVSIIKKSLQKV